MATFKQLYKRPRGTFVGHEPHGDGDVYVTLLITPENFEGEWHEVLDEAFDEAGGELLEDPEYQIFGFYNVSHEEFDPEDGEVPPQFDAVLFFKESKGGQDGPIFAFDVDGGAAGDPELWADSFEEVGFTPV